MQWPATLVLALSALVACDRNDPAPAGDPAARASGAVSLPPAAADLAAATPDAEAPGATGGAIGERGADTQTRDAGAADGGGEAGVIDASVAPASSASAKPAGPTCGTKPLPDCPLQAWMKAHTSAAMTKADFPTLAAALDDTAKLAPPGPGYPNWVSISRDGADAARAKSLDAVKAACRGCHNQYKDKYKGELRMRPTPP